ncbi:hypothetical protein G9C85_00615 [Halorubellus sp. JP-L1]|uniref:right-handed parallel beta-helix repeat-containing protein n=1 Tax=Halorubellus sp. JP-L1 TaxID=2715753 RepID=UPI0014084AD9|nr:right-handed parallel beta-helix repeat-containing protein [Halorubellus sp. JP-L1]NHN40138.1 hypothetical protein [Halorubellus sp. JP-L1]
MPNRSTMVLVATVGIALALWAGVLLAPFVGLVPATVSDVSATDGSASGESATDENATDESRSDERASTHQPVQIDSCTVIDEPGEYVLTADVEDSTAGVCIDIRSSDVHFDGDRHAVAGNLSHAGIGETIDGPSSQDRVGVGVTVRSNERVENVTIHHVTVTNWSHGVLAENVTDANVSGVHAFENGGGIVLDDANDVTVQESNASRNLALGVVVDARAGNRTTNDVVVGNELKDNGAFGAAVFSSSNATIANNTAFRNAFGIYAFGVQNSTIAANSVWDNRYGVVLEGFRSNATNVADAVNVTDADASAADLGVQPEAETATTARSNAVADNVIRNSTAAALAFVGADGNVATGNDLSDTGPTTEQFYPFQANASAAIVAVDARNNTIVDARTSDAADWICAGFDGSSTTVLNATTDAGTVSFAGSDVGVGRAIETPSFPWKTYSVGVDLNVTTFAANTTLQVTLQYDDASLERFNASEDDLDVYRYDADAANWTTAGDVDVNATRNTVSASLDRVDGFVAVLAETGNYATENQSASENETTTDDERVTMAPGGVAGANAVANAVGGVAGADAVAMAPLTARESTYAMASATGS